MYPFENITKLKIINTTLTFVSVTTVDQLRPGTHGHNLQVKVVSSNVVLEKTRTDGSKIKISECLVGDGTGSIVLTARNGKITHF